MPRPQGRTSDSERDAAWTGAARAPKLAYEPALDGVRGVAIALVVSWHAFGWPARGFLGVQMFFVLSGFLITTLLLQEWHRTGSISLPSFYRRRALRLLPALAALLITYAVVQAAREALNPGALDLSTALKGALIGAFYITNIAQAAGVVLPVALNHLWSLAAEEQFYLLWPFALAAALRRGVPRRVMTAGLTIAIVLVALQRLYVSLGDASRARLHYGPDVSFDAILVGCLLGIWFAAGEAPRALRSARAVRLAVFPALAVVLLSVVVVGTDSKPAYWGALLPFSIASGLVIWALMTRRARWLERALGVRPLVALGVISYSLYLWHPIVIWSGSRLAGLPTAVGAALAVAVATGSYVFVERPFLRLKRRERVQLERAREVPDGLPRLRREGGSPSLPWFPTSSAGRPRP
jgi:peptidoglycan/LPS O-acetylase OafA/YrhL